MTDQQATLYSVTFLPVNRTVQLAPDETLIQGARQVGIHINASCGGNGVCGKCLVVVESGEITGGKSEKLSKGDYDAGQRQACTAVAASDAVVLIPEMTGSKEGVLTLDIPVRRRAQMHIFNVDHLKEEGVFIPPVEKKVLEIPPPSHADNMADAGRLIQGLNNQYDERKLIVPLSVLKKIRRTLRQDNFLVTATLVRPVNKNGKSKVVNIQAGDWSLRNYGLAFDIGTTTVYGTLLDLHTGEVLARGGDYNGQISYGEDVITRIIFAEKPKGLKLMHNLVVKTINSIIKKLLKKSKIKTDEISSITISANTTMTHLFLELEPHNIRRAPYVPVSTFFPPIRATDLDLKLPEHAIALLYPSISSYVGGDIVAGVMGSGMYRSEKLTLYIDIGTNAEIVIGNKDWLACAACSAGPAFEGGGITHGMRAASGAISDFSLHPTTYEPMNITIDNKPVKGICGSGLLVIIASFFELGVVDRSGKYNRELDTQRIREGRSGYEFVLAWEEESGTDSDIVLNEVDIENFIRAKGAIFAGCKTLVDAVGLEITDLEQIILAGAFGSFIDLDSAMTVGLLPEIDAEKIMYVGNGSMLGSWMSELSNHIRRDVVDVVRKMTSFELSEVPIFKEEYIASLFLPHTDSTLFPEVTRRKEVIDQAINN